MAQRHKYETREEQNENEKENKKRQTIDIKYCVAFVTVRFSLQVFVRRYTLGVSSFFK